ncbi:MAG: TonB-dependent receptor [Acidobacteriia bacterium]|nr:TonB-dependent receptor [Terriglobia bacterium]
MQRAVLTNSLARCKLESFLSQVGNDLPRPAIWRPCRSEFPLRNRKPATCVFTLVASLVLCACGLRALTSQASWHGLLRDAAGKNLAGASVVLRAEGSGREYTTVTDSAGAFSFDELPAGNYSLAVQGQGSTSRASARLTLHSGERRVDTLRLIAGDELKFEPQSAEGARQAGQGERLSSRDISELPLNKRDFSQLLLLAAGTMTDTNGAANFTQQFAMNGQRGTTAVFAMDGIDITDPEMGGATFSNFNVDAIQEIQSSSGVLPAEIGQGAAGFTNIVTKSGTNALHGSVFEFVRNAAFDARNFFDRRSLAQPGRIPPFVRNEFGFTNGGPVVMPGLYDGRGRTFYFGQYQGFRQVLGTTQVLAVPTLAERQGLDTTAFRGDTLVVPIDPRVEPALAGYPRPNDPRGPFGARTYATSSRVATTTDQFSLRIDHRISAKARLLARFNFNQVNGPLTNPSQTAIDPSFAIRFFDHQRNFGLSYTRTPSANFVSESSFGVIRSTPMFPTVNHTQPALKFADGLYEAFNAPGGGVMGAHGALLQARQNFTWVRGAHTFKFGGEARFNRDATFYGLAPNGQYTFGGGTAYAPVAMASMSGLHNLLPGDPLPDSLTGFLTASPYSYTAAVAAPLFPQGEDIGESAIRREAYNVYFQDTWKASPRLTLNFGLRYEVNTPIREAKHLTSSAFIVGPDGQPARYWDPGVRQKVLFYPQPPYAMDWNGWGPRLSLEWRATDNTVLRAGGSISTLLPNLWQDNFMTGGAPFVFYPYVTASSGAPVPFENAVTAFNLPPVYTPSGQLVFATGRSMDVPANTELDLLRFERDLAAVSPGHMIQPLSLFVMAQDFRNGYIGTYTAGVEHREKSITLSAAYVATIGVHLPSAIYPNGFGGADAAYSPFTERDATGRIVGGYGSESLMTSPSHSTYHALQLGAGKTSERAGLGFEASYTFSKSLDDTSTVLGGQGGGPGPEIASVPQDPRNPGAEKGPSTFDINQVFTLSLIQALPLERVDWLQSLGKKLTAGWQLLSIATLASGPPFTVFSGIQQTGAGSNGADRPDQIGRPDFSTHRPVREDYFGRGADNSSFFSIPIGVPDGTGPNQGRFGTLGRNTFRGPGYHNVDLSLIKDTAFGRRGNAEALTLQFRAEFFNVFNLVNFGLPSNIVRGSGFGLISSTAGPSRQIQFSLKLLY